MGHLREGEELLLLMDLVGFGNENGCLILWRCATMSRIFEFLKMLCQSTCC